MDFLNYLKFRTGNYEFVGGSWVNKSYDRRFITNDILKKTISILRVVKQPTVINTIIDPYSEELNCYNDEIRKRLNHDLYKIDTNSVTVNFMGTKVYPMWTSIDLIIRDGIHRINYQWLLECLHRYPILNFEDGWKKLIRWGGLWGYPEIFRDYHCIMNGDPVMFRYH